MNYYGAAQALYQSPPEQDETEYEIAEAVAELEQWKAVEEQWKAANGLCKCGQPITLRDAFYSGACRDCFFMGIQEIDIPY